ncbi:MAG: hypothetical protein Q9225_006637 [Loekoesia sp. 1 TL-2023]
MVEPLSATASIIAVVGFAAESSKLMFKVFQGVVHRPANIHDASLALKSLYVTLTNLQQRSTKLDPKYEFPAHFCQRLNDCLKDLKTFEAKIGKVDAILGKEGTRKRDWDGKTRRSWERIRWLLVGEQETRRFLEKVKLYQNEFSLELLGLLTLINGSPTSSRTWPGSLAIAATATDSSSSLVLAQRLSQPLHCPECPAPTTALPVGHLPPTAGIQNPENSVQSIDPSKFGDPCVNLTRDAPLGVPAPYFLSPSIRVAFIQRWSFFLCVIVSRCGPAIAPSLDRNQKAQSSAQYQKIGVGLGLSLIVPKHFCRKLDLGIYLVHASFLSRMRLTLHCDIDFPRVIPRSAEVMQCVKEGSVDNVQRLIRAGKATSKDLTTNGTTLLHLAAATGNLRLIRLLIQEGGDVNAQDEDGETPLHWAMTREGNYEVARLLIQNGADLANRTVDGSTPLHMYFNDTIAKILSRDGWIEETLPNSQGMSIAHFLAWSSKSTSELLEKGVAHTSAGLWSVDGFGRTCLHLAASRGNIDILGYLLERASLTEVRRKDYEGRTALHYTVQSKRLKAVDMLLASGADLHAKDNLSQNLLHFAARWGNLEAAQKVLALDNSKVLLSPDKHGHLPSYLACSPKATEVRNFLGGAEAAASLDMVSKRQEPSYQSSSPGMFPKAKLNALPSVQYSISVLIVATLLSALNSVSIRGFAVPVVSATVCVILAWLRIERQPFKAAPSF